MATNRRRLGVFQNSLAVLLSHDPSQRPSVAEFCDKCDRKVAVSTTAQVKCGTELRLA